MPHKSEPASAGRPVEVAPDEAYLQIGEVAERTGVTQRTLRFYEEKGLVQPPTRMEGGFRLYSEEDIQRVERIRRLQKHLGFTLAEIKEMVEAEEVKMQLRAEYRPEAAISEKKAQVLRAIELTERQHALIRQKVAALTDMQSKLEERLETYNGWLRQLDEEAKSKGKAKAKA
ncbi:MAG: MerR family transcriptional regulator [Dehalococcoidia bacterium]